MSLSKRESEAELLRPNIHLGRPSVVTPVLTFRVPLCVTDASVLEPFYCAHVNCNVPAFRLPTYHLFITLHTACL